jgi:hypothetical protein
MTTDPVAPMSAGQVPDPDELLGAGLGTCGSITSHVMDSPCWQPKIVVRVSLMLSNSSAADPHLGMYLGGDGAPIMK